MIHEYPIVQTQIRLRKHDLRMRIYVFTDCFEVMSYLELAWDYPNHEFWFGEFLWYIERWCLGDLVLKSTQPRWVFYSLRKCTFMYLIDLQMIYDFITEPTICWQYVLNVLSSFNYEVSMMFMRNGCLTGKCDLNWFEEFDYLLLLRFKLCKCWLMNWGVKLFMDLHWKHELKACSWN